MSDEKDKSEANTNGPVERPIAPQGGFLAGFLAARDAAEAPPETTDTVVEQAIGERPENKEQLTDQIVEALRQIYDPEIPVNIYDMGLIYEVDVKDDWSVDLVMTLTSPHCPVAETMPGEVEMKVNAVAGVNGVSLQLVWDPPWDMGKMSDEARLELGLL